MRGIEMKGQNIGVSGGQRTSAEEQEASRNKVWFERNAGSWEEKMQNFPKYVRRQNITRFLVLYEIFKKVINIKGSVVECGVNQGFGLMSWAKFSAIIEPVNLTRRIYGFDTFEGFPEISKADMSKSSDHLQAGDLAADTFDELNGLNEIHDSTRFLGHVPKTSLIKGDATKTIPKFIEQNPHLLVSLLYLDFDLYEPTKTALEYFFPKMPKGAVIAFDELDNPLWPGETKAMLEFFEDQKLSIQRVPFDPYVGFAVVE
jgi:hypothetical protein